MFKFERPLLSLPRDCVHLSKPEKVGPRPKFRKAKKALRQFIEQGITRFYWKELKRVKETPLVTGKIK